MSRLRSALRACILVLVHVLVLASCGGGGGGDGGSFRVSYDTTSLDFEYMEGNYPTGQTITGSAIGTLPASGLYAGVTVDGPGIEQPVNIYLDEAAGKAYIPVQPMYGLSAGTYSGTITLLACANPNCTSQYAGSPRRVPYTIHVRAPLSVSLSSLTLSAVERQSATPVPLDVNLPPGVAAATVTVSYAAGASGWLQVQNNGSSLELTPVTGTLRAGTYQATVKLVAGDQVAEVPVSFTVILDPQLHLHADLDSIEFAGAETQAIPTQTLQVDLAPGATTYTTSFSYVEGASGWLQVSKSGTTISLKANSTGLLAGTYVASLKVTSASETLTIPVTLSVGMGLVWPGETTQTINNISPGTGQFTVQAAPGVTTTQWTAESSQPWLVVDATTGAMGEDLKWHLDATAFNALPNDADYVAYISVYGDHLTGVSYTVTARKRMVEISHLDTLALGAGETGDVLLYGKGFASLVTTLGDVLQISGGLTPVSVTVLSDKVARVRLQDVPAGDYDVTLTTKLGQPTRTRTLRVLAPQVYSYQAIDTAGTKGALVWDPVHQAAFAVDTTLDRIHRFGWNGSTFVNTVTSMLKPYKLGLDREYQTLVVTAENGVNGLVKRLDPVTMAEISSTNANFYMANGDRKTAPLLISGDNRLWLNILTAFDLDTGTVQSPYGAGSYFWSGPAGFVSGNGRVMIFTSTGATTSPPPATRIDLLTGTPTSLPSDPYTNYFGNASWDHAGTRWLLDTYRLYDADGLNQGGLTIPTGWYSTLVGRLSRDGTRAYVLAMKEGAISVNTNGGESTTADKPRVLVYDTRPLSAAQTTFPLLGYFELQDYAGCRTYYGNCSPQTMIALAQDNRTLFLAGDRKFIVAPIPDAYLPESVAPAAAPAGIASMVVRPAAPRVPMTMKLWRRTRL